jgi:hypothetical protein
MALKTRNAIILAPHPKCAKLNVVITDEIRATLKKLGYPEDLVQTCAPEWVKLGTSQELMKQCDFILATGGEALVETAYSSGTPAIGVGVGNCCSIVTGKTPMAEVADMIVTSKKYDNATSCSTENNIIVFEDCFDEFVKEMEDVKMPITKFNALMKLLKKQIKEYGRVNKVKSVEFDERLRKVVDEYNNDPLSGFTFTTNGFKSLFLLMKETYSLSNWNKENLDLPIHFIAGEDDPCITNIKEFNNSVNVLKEVGYKNVSSQLFKNMRHEILNEVNKENVYKNILKTLKSWE